MYDMGQLTDLIMFKGCLMIATGPVYKPCVFSNLCRPPVAGEAPRRRPWLPAEPLHAGLRQRAPGPALPAAVCAVSAQEQAAPHHGRPVLERHLRQLCQPCLPRGDQVIFIYLFIFDFVFCIFFFSLETLFLTLLPCLVECLCSCC